MTNEARRIIYEYIRKLITIRGEKKGIKKKGYEGKKDQQRSHYE